MRTKGRGIATSADNLLKVKEAIEVNGIYNNQKGFNFFLSLSSFPESITYSEQKTNNHRKNILFPAMHLNEMKLRMVLVGWFRRGGTGK